VRSNRLRLLAATLLSATLAVTLVAPAQAHGGGGHHPVRYPDRIELPDGFLPEGIAIGREPVAYLGSRADGDIYAADLRTGRGEVISQGPGTPSVGLKLDRHGLLYVAGGTAGNARVVDVRSGRVVQDYPFATGSSFVNDVVLTRKGAWFTDSAQPRLYGAQLSKGKPTGAFTVLPLTGDWQQVAGNNANGIAQTPDRRALLVVNSALGLLYRVDPGTGVARRVDLGGYAVTNGDGLLLKGRTLYVVQNRLNTIAVLRLDARGTRGRLVATITSPHFDVPSTVAAYRGSLYLPNARFTSPQEPTTQFWVTRVDR
jgi:sugar lactone lactonase YvrE